jgi:hypothetical protein
MNGYDHGLYMGIQLRNNIPGHLHGCPIGWMIVGSASASSKCCRECFRVGILIVAVPSASNIPYLPNLAALLVPS